jgi:predicted metal-binding membrane protein
MSSISLEILLKRDRRIVVCAIVVLTALAWGYLIWAAQTMPSTGMSMLDIPAIKMSAVMTPMLHAWTARDFAFIFLTWAIMMVGMMTQSATPMILIYARVAHQAEKDGKSLASTGWFAFGYFLSWTVFSLFAAVLQGALEHASLLNPMIVAATPRIGGMILIAAGLYQGTPMKQACLRHCRSPFAFLQTHGGFRKGIANSVRLGVRHGFYCIGCCWMLMVLLFAVGVMNVAWIAVISIYVLIEKVVSAGRAVSWLSGAALIVAGVWFLFRS